MKIRFFLRAALWLALASCSPKDTVPGGTTHPASPAVPTDEPAPGTATDDAHAGEIAPATPADEHAGPGATTASDDKEKIATAEQTAYERAKPIFDKHCARCHTSSGKKAKKKTLGHFSMDSYPFGGHHAAEAGEEVREVLGLAGKKATMPKDDPGAVTGDELRVIEEWSKAFDAAHAAGLHPHGTGGHGGH